MPTIKEYNQKINSLKNTQKITRTMKMVSASKLRKAQQAQANAKLYAQNLKKLTARIASSADHALFEKRTSVRNILILIFTSDKGLCGAFNNNANKRVESWIRENEGNHEKVDLSFCGKRGFMYFQKRHSVYKNYENVTINPSFDDAQRIGFDLKDSFLNGDYDEVYVAYNEFFSPLSQVTLFEKILPVDPDALISKEIESSGEYIFEPAVEKLLDYLIDHYLYFKIYFALLENAAGEHGARMTSMDSATKNAVELTDQYTLSRNRARQAAITTELTEIVAGAEALK